MNMIVLLLFPHLIFCCALGKGDLKAIHALTPNSSNLIPNLVGTVEFCTIPAGIELIFGIIGLLWRPNAKIVSSIQHLSAGVVTSVVAVELVPLLLSSLKKTVLDYVAMIVGFIVAVMTLSLIAYFLPCQCDDACDANEKKCCEKKQGDKSEKSCSTSKCSTDACNSNEKKKCCEKKQGEESEKNCSTSKCSTDACKSNEKKKCCESEKNCTSGNNCDDRRESSTLLINQDKTGDGVDKSTIDYLKDLPWLMLIPVAIDTFLDGILLALTYVARPHAGLVISIGFAFETAILGIMTSFTLRHKGFPILYPLFTTVLFAVLFYLGGILGAIIFSQGQGNLFLAFLSFGVGALLFLVTDDLLIEARENKSAVTWFTKLQFFVGFLAVLILHEVVE